MLYFTKMEIYYILQVDVSLDESHSFHHHIYCCNYLSSLGSGIHVVYIRCSSKGDCTSLDSAPLQSFREVKIDLIPQGGGPDDHSKSKGKVMSPPTVPPDPNTVGWMYEVVS